MNEHKHIRFDMCMQLLELYYTKWELLLRPTVTEDETWIHHYKPESKHHSTMEEHNSTAK